MMKTTTPHHSRQPGIHRWIRLGLVLLLSASLFLFARTPSGPHPAQAQSTALMRCEPTFINAPPSSTVSVDIYVENVVDLYGADFKLSFDTSLVQVLDSLPDENEYPGVNILPLDTFLKPDLVFINDVDNTTGVIEFTETQLNPTPAVTGEGPIAQITFQNLQEGSFTLQFTRGRLSQPGGVPIATTTQDCVISFCNAYSEVWVDELFTPANVSPKIWGCNAHSVIQNGINIVSAGGKVNVAPGTYPENLAVPKDITLVGEDMPVVDAGGGNGLSVSAGNVTLKGFTFQNMSTAFTVANGASLLAYANNVLNYTTALAGGGIFTGRHNFWDSYFTQPPGLDSTNWNARLGADVEAWAESTTNAALSGAYISGTLVPGRQLVIVEHGREFPSDAPFGNGIVPHANNMCSPYYDIFTVGGSSEDVITYEIGLPVDDRTACLTNSLDKERAYWVPDFSESKCTPADNSQCWDPFPANRITKDTPNKLLKLSALTIEELGGTPFVVGDDQGGDPTFVSLTSFSAAGASTPSPLLLVQVFLLLLGLGIWVHARKTIPAG